MNLETPIVNHSRVDQISKELLDIESKLESNLPVTMWISDLHGAGDRFKAILKGRFGLLYQTCVEALPKTFSPKKIVYLSRIIRKRAFCKGTSVHMDRQDVIRCLVEVLRYKLSNELYSPESIIPDEFQNIIMKLLSNSSVPNLVFENELISDRLIHHLSVSILQVLMDHLIVLGDIFDRGSQPDKIIRILSALANQKKLHFIFGNHDLLWMGACGGNRSLVAEALRITFRYDHFELLKRLNFDFSKLSNFAQKYYPPEKITGKIKAKTDLGRSIEKALAMIQFKLEEMTIRSHPEFEMDSRLWLDRLAHMLKVGETEGLNDTHFPTLNLDHPGALLPEEEEVINFMTEQFQTNRKLKRLVGFFFKEGKTYHVHNGFLNIHALIPSTPNGEFEDFLGYKGKPLLNFIHETIQRVGDIYLTGEGKAEEKDLAFLFYLWCGPKSPFFGKDAMKTFERYFLLDKATHKETSLYWKENLGKESFREKILDEFQAKRVVHGHVPINYSKGQKIASYDGAVINIDGGFAAAYFDRGHALVQTPWQIYGIILPTQTELNEAVKSKTTAKLQVEIIEDLAHPRKIKDTRKGALMMERKNELLRQLEQEAKTNG